MTIEFPIGKPNLHVFLGDFYLTKGAATEFFGKEEFSGSDIGHGKVGEGDVTDRPGGVGLGGCSLQTVAKEGQFIAVRVVVGVLQITREVPPFGFEFGMGSVVPRERPNSGGEGAGPRVGRIKAGGSDDAEENRKEFFHSERRASAGERREARQAGGREARRQAIIIPIPMPTMDW